MKKTIIVIMLACMLFVLNGCRIKAGAPESSATPTPAPTQTQTPTPVVTPSPSPSPYIPEEERKRMELYIAAMHDAVGRMNGGDGFIAIDLDTLEGLGDTAKGEVLKAFLDISDEVYALEDIKTDETKLYLYERDGSIHMDGTKDGTLLYVWVHEYADDHAVITAISWFGSLAAVLPKYEADYIDGAWQLECVGMPIS